MADEYDNLIDSEYTNNPPQESKTPTGDEYDQILDNERDFKKTSLQASMHGAVDQDPGKQARVRQLSDSMNLPQDYVNRNFDTLTKKQKLSKNDYDSIIDETPQLAGWLSDTSNMALAQNEIEPLKRIEKAKSIFVPKSPGVTDLVSDLGGATKTGFHDLAAGSAHLMAAYGKMDIDRASEIIAEQNKIAAERREQRPSYVKDFNAAIEPEMEDVSREFERFSGSYETLKQGHIKQALSDFAGGGTMTVMESLDFIGEAVNGSKRLKGLSYVVSESLAHSAPSLLGAAAGAKAGATTGGAIGTAVTPGVGTAGGAAVGGIVGGITGGFATGAATEVGAWINGELQQRGIDVTDPEQIKQAYSDPVLMNQIVAEAERKGVTTAGVDAVFAMFGGRFLKAAKGTGVKGVASKAVRGAADVGVEATGEVVGEAAGQFAATGEIDAGEAVFEGIASLGQSVGQTAILAGPRAAIDKVKQGEVDTDTEVEVDAPPQKSELRDQYSADPIAAAEEIYNDSEMAIKAHKDFEVLGEMTEAASQLSDVMQVDGALAEVIDQASEGRGTDTVFFNQDDWDSYWTGKGESPSQKALEISERAAESYLEANSTGGQVEVPIGEYLEKMTKTGDVNELNKIAKAQPDGMTFDQAQQYLNDLNDLMVEVANEAIAEDQVIEGKDTSREVGKVVEEQLKQIPNMSATDAKLQAQVYESRIRQRAELRGMDAKELFDSEGGIEIQFLDQLVEDQSGQKVFNQPKRGQIKFGGEDGIQISLFKDADPSTFLHETGHLWLEQMRTDFEAINKIADKTPQQEQFIEDANEILKWLEVSSFDEIGTEQHEQFARGTEAYFMEGNAPTRGLRKAFARFKVWLTSVYRQMKNLNVELTTEVRQVMNRMLAAEDQIAEAKRAAGATPLFEDAREMGFSEDQASKYENSRLEWEIAAEEELSAELIADYRKEQQKHYKKQRAKEVEAATEIVEEIRVFKAMDELREGVQYDGTPMKLDKKALVDVHGKDFVQNNLPKPNIYVAKDGLNPEIAAELLGYNSADEMIGEISQAPKKEDMIQQMADERMKTLHPDIIVSQEQIQEEASRAVHTEKRDEMLRLELELLIEHDFPTFQKIIKNTVKRLPPKGAVKRQAQDILGKKNVEDIRPIVFERAERKASKLAGEALAKGDIDEAFRQKRRELLNYHLHKESLEIKKNVEKSIKDFKKRFKKKDKDLAKSRDINFILAARTVLAEYGLAVVDREETKLKLGQLQEYDPESYSTIVELINSATEDADNYKVVPYDKFEEMKNTVDSLWDLSRTSREIQIGGEKRDVAEVREQLIDEIGDFVKSGPRAGYDKAATKWEKNKRSLMGFKSSLRRMEAWADAMDKGKVGGLFKTSLFVEISEASDTYRIEQAKRLEEFTKLIETLGNRLTEGGPIDANEFGYQFENRGELLGAMLHTGNISNFQKLLIGRKWGHLREDGTLDRSRWDAFMDRMHAEGKIIKQDWDFVQANWDLMEQLKPMAQKAHKQMFGHFFSEITNDEFETPFGTYRGGYAPAVTDPFIVQDAAIRKEKEDLEAINNSFMFPTAGGKGFTKSRVEQYAKPLALDLKLYPRHLDQVLKFSIVKPRVAEASRLVFHDDFQKAMEAVDPTVVPEMIIPFLQRADKQIVEEPVKGSSWKALAKIAKYMRGTAGLNIMFLNVTNAMQQFTGFTIAAVKVKPKYLRRGLWKYMRNSKEINADIHEKSDFMKTRNGTQIFDISKRIDDIILNPTKYEKGVEFARQNGYILQTMFQNVVDNVAWLGAYDESIEKGMNEKAAVRHANSVVRLTQGSFNAEDISAFESGTAFRRMFTMFYSYFNMQFNLLGTEALNIQNTVGFNSKEGRARLFYVYVMGFMLPAFLSEMIVKSAAGELDDDDDEQYLDDVMQSFFMSQVRTATALVPIGGQIANTGINQLNDKWFDDRISTSPAINTMESALGTLKSVPRAIGKGEVSKQSVRDTLTLLSLLSGAPLSPLAKPTGYLIDVEQGKARPSGPIDFTRGLITGKPGN